jgi:membrane-associated phospholipid phosphatase
MNVVITDTPPTTTSTKRRPLAFLAVHVAWGVLLSIAALWAFVAIADEVPEKGAMVRWDLAIADWIERTSTETGEAVFSVVSWLGAPVLVLLIVVLVATFAIRRDWLRAGGVAITAAGGWLLDQLLKVLFHRGRPEHAAEFIHRASWSFPSGHAMSSTVCYGFLLYLTLERVADQTRRRMLVALTAILIFMVSVSRMYLGVHYLSDVVGGFLAGAVWLMACIAGYRLVERRSGARSLATRSGRPVQDS